MQLESRQDDMDFGDIAAFSQDMSDKADEFQTLGEVKLAKEKAEEDKKKMIAKKKVDDKAKLEKKKKEKEKKLVQ